MAAKHGLSHFEEKLQITSGYNVLRHWAD